MIDKGNEVMGGMNNYILDILGSKKLTGTI